MNILMVCSEYAPVAKTGGLADAVAGLSAALEGRNNDIRVLLPWYGHLSEAAGAKRNLGPIGTGRIFQTLKRQSGAKLYFLDVPGIETDTIYTGDARDATRFANLANAALRLGNLLDWHPDVIHCHDWHAGLTPGLRRFLSGSERSAPVVLTIHNLGYQGMFPARAVERTAFPELRSFLKAHPKGKIVNFLATGIREADLVTTVSPTYAREIQTPEYGMGLETLLRARGDDLVGILNGVDYRHWGPSDDPFLDVGWDATDPAPKRQVKAALCDALFSNRATPDPVVGLVSRLAAQKGVDLMIEALPELLSTSKARFAVLGNGDPDVEASLRSLAGRHPGRVSFTAGFDESLAHRIIAGSDLLLVPSRYEPCGLTQMYALRYGTVPVVRATGGLADTIQHFDPSSGIGNGSVFEHADPQGLTWGLRCALDWYRDDGAWKRLMSNAMKADFAWPHQSELYEDAYRRVFNR